MIRRSSFLLVLFVCSSYMLDTEVVSAASAMQSNTHAQNNNVKGRVYGKVVTTMDASGYTYAEVDTGKEKVWGAARKTALKKGDMIAFSTGMPMKNYYSKSLKREFSVVYFVDRFITDKVSSTDHHDKSTSPHAGIKQKQSAKPVKGIEKVEGGKTIAEIYENKTALKGKTVRVRGKVSKFTASVMGKNWLHIRDSSGLQDLTVTTSSSASIDDIVVIEGKLAVDKNFNYGYVYPVIVEEAEIKKE